MDRAKNALNRLRNGSNNNVDHPGEDYSPYDNPAVVAPGGPSQLTGPQSTTLPQADVNPQTLANTQFPPPAPPPRVAVTSTAAHGSAPSYTNQPHPPALDRPLPPTPPDDSHTSHLRRLDILPSISLSRLAPSKRTSKSSPAHDAPYVQPREAEGPSGSIAAFDYQPKVPEHKAGWWARTKNGFNSAIGNQHDGANVGEKSAMPAPAPQAVQQARYAQQTQYAQRPPNSRLNYTTYGPEYVDFLDTIDPEVQTLTSLTNVQNSLFVPNLGKWVNRRPMYKLSSLIKGETRTDVETTPALETVPEANQASRPRHHLPHIPERPAPVRRLDTVNTIDSSLSDSRYAVLPHDTYLDGWSKEDKAELNDHVRHMLHSRRSRFKRAMRGFGQYVRRPLGFLVTLYATLITLFGLAWVLFLIGWINVGGKQLYLINIIDYTLVALFAIVGDGLAPFRAVDTYRMIYIARYHHLTLRIREQQRMPSLADHNDLPTELPPPRPKKYARATKTFYSKWNTKLNPFKKPKPEKDPEEPYQEYSVLKAKQQERLMHHQQKFAKSHTFYKPHETETHFAFPWRLLVAIVILLDFHSLLQISLGAVTWGIDYHKRPMALTTVILCCSITCNATAGVLIMIGDRRTRKKDVLERMNRQELTQEAIEKMQDKWEREEQEEQGVAPSTAERIGDTLRGRR